MGTEIAGPFVRALIGRKLEPRFSATEAIFQGFSKVDKRFSGARNSNLRSICLEIPLVGQEPIEIEFSQKWFLRGENGSLGVIRCGEFESEVYLPRNPIGEPGTNRNRVFLKMVP